MEELFGILTKTFWSIVVALGFAVLFNTPKRSLWAVGFLGALGFAVKLILIDYLLPGQDVVASFVGAAIIGISGIYFAHKVHTPPIVFTVPAVITMIPGRPGYHFFIGLFKIATSDHTKVITFEFFLEVFNNGLKAAFIMMALALGVIFPILFFNKSTAKKLKNKNK